jgi:hypothetical protein
MISQRGSSLKIRLLTALLFIMGMDSLGVAQQEARLSVTVSPQNELVIVIGSLIHERYGVAYPLTYRISLPPGSTGLHASRRFSSAGTWTILSEKSPSDYFNAIETARFDYAGDLAYISARFGSGSDSLFIRLTTSGGITIKPGYRGISTYYDNRTAAVTVTGDDCADWTYDRFPAILECFRSYGLYTTAAIITGQGWTSSPTWSGLQQLVDSGFVELASHGRTHSYTPYSDYVGEVEGSADDIVNNVHLPGLFRNGTREYVYVWVAPYGEFDTVIDSLVGVRGYLVSRLYTVPGDSAFTSWDDSRGHFTPLSQTLEIGAPSWGGGETDTTVLNGTFDRIVAQGGIYHLMWHAQTVDTDLDLPYFKNHLSHISGRKDIWYVNLGHLYLYHLLQVVPGSTESVSKDISPAGVQLLQNYPNPFNPSTDIKFQIPDSRMVNLAVFDILGREAAVLMNERKAPGVYDVRFDASGMASGIYLLRLQAGNFVQTRKMVVVK